ncbi:hypothetical protein CMQ_4121 [Grosmannia clavigera kw1407]|uniref:Uncharacterized protein n=1 Tax=Grosmannia clavigera (strain kw1407 / UAMH 11150) TaxID=655863 RepID=F0XAE8_GROCL|nr:uncharacterized protein CMQ_4121 [Grosmannia clavigera kw1407]EFX06052.1 hypothetical protein CMQ_4121 [Grosmannia clavigera kw1407]
MSITSLLNPAGSSRPESPSSETSSRWPSPSALSSSSASTSGSAVAMQSPAAAYYSDRVVMTAAGHAIPGAKPPQMQRLRLPAHVVTEFVRARPKGTVYFRPFQSGLDARAKRAVEDFRVFPFGRIEEYCRHIPYASGKKDFHQKTGREGFEGTYRR